MSGEYDGPSDKDRGINPEAGEGEASVDELLQFAKFEIVRVTELLNTAIKKNSKVETKSYGNLLDKSRKRLDLLKTEARISEDNLGTLRENVSKVAEEEYEKISTATEDEFDAAKAESEAWDDLKTFLEQNAGGNFRKRKDFEKWKQEQSTQMAVLEEARAKEREAVATRYAEADKANENEARERIFMATILEQGGAGMYTSFPKQFHPKGYAGYEASYDSKRDGSNRSFFIAKDEKEFYKKEDVNEVVQLVPMVEQIKEDVMQKSGIFRKPVKISERVVGEKSIQHDALVRGGKKEAAFKFVYKAHDTYNEDDLKKRMGREKGSFSYMDYSGRGGQFLMVDVIIPESVARQLAEKIKEDPAFARRLADYVCKQDLRGKATPEEWEGFWKEGKGANGFPLRPPYEDWASLRGGQSKMLIDCRVPGVYETPKDPRESIVKIKA